MGASSRLLSACSDTTLHVKGDRTFVSLPNGTAKTMKSFLAIRQSKPELSPLSSILKHVAAHHHLTMDELLGLLGL
jgi:hypothetical protein